MEEQEQERIKQTFTARRVRQTIAVAAAIVLLIAAAALHRRPDLFGDISKTLIMKAQLVVILLFVNFTAFNWRCPSCGKYLGSDIGRRTCKHCRTTLR